jgi:hypothetical protein
MPLINTSRKNKTDIGHFTTTTRKKLPTTDAFGPAKGANDRTVWSMFLFLYSLASR